MAPSMGLSSPFGWNIPFYKGVFVDATFVARPVELPKHQLHCRSNSQTCNIAHNRRSPL
jgi:hypothetical protein